MCPHQEPRSCQVWAAVQIRASLNRFACFKPHFGIDLEEIPTYVVLPSGLASFTRERERDRERMVVDEMMLSFALHQFRVLTNPDFFFCLFVYLFMQHRRFCSIKILTDIFH